MAKTDPTKPDISSGTPSQDTVAPSATNIPQPPTAGQDIKPLEPKPPVAGGKGKTPTPPAPKKGDVKSDPPKGGKSNNPPNPAKKPAPKKPPTPKKRVQGKGDKPPEKTAEKLEPEPEVASTKALFSGKAKKFVHLDSSELHDFHTFRKHPYQVKDNAEMFALVEKVKRGGVREPVLVRPQPKGGYEILSGHRRRRANDLAEGGKLPCIVVEMNDQEAVRAMAEGNSHREKRLPSELARLLDLEVEAIKRQGARDGTGERSTEIVGKEYGLTGKQVQRRIDLLKLEPKLLDMLDEGRLKISPAQEIAHISKKNQKIILDTIENLQSTPSTSQALRMKKLDDKGNGILNADMIEGIMSEEKKEEIQVVINSQELSKYFGPDKTPKQMKEAILKVMDEHLPKLPEKTQPDKNAR